MEVREKKSSQNQNRSPSPHPADSPPGPDQPHPAGAPLPQGVNSAGYSPETQRHPYEIAMAALAHVHQHQHPGLHIPLPYPGQHPLQTLPAHIQGIYQHPPPPPLVNTGTRPGHGRKAGARRDDGDDDEGGGSESDGGDDSDEYVPPPGQEGEDGEAAAAPRMHRRGRRSRGNEHDGDAAEHDERNGDGRDNQPLHMQRHPHPPPHGMPPLPPDAHYQMESQQSLTTMGSQSQSLGESSFMLDPHGIVGPVHGLEDSQGSPKQPKRGRKHMNDEDWNRQRKDNHKEVERRRRGNINEGIGQLAAIVPNTTGGEKAKGAILTRAVQYIHQLKDNEARNIEKWTLEKLLMDQAMGDLQAQLEELKRRWDLEVQARMAVERELEIFKSRASTSAEAAEVGQKRPRTD